MKFPFLLDSIETTLPKVGRVLRRKFPFLLDSIETLCCDCVTYKFQEFPFLLDSIETLRKGVQYVDGTIVSIPLRFD